MLDKKIKSTANEFNLYAKKYLSFKKERTDLWRAMQYGLVNGG